MLMKQRASNPSVAFIVLFGVLILGSFTYIQPTVAESSYRYALVLQYPDNTVIIRQVDPGAPTDTDDSLSIPIRHEIIDASVSPNNRWVVLLSNRGTITLIDAITGVSAEVTVGQLIPVTGRTWGTPVTHLIWSPDSRKLAFKTLGDDGSIDTYLYEIASGNMANITDDTKQQFSLAWSRDASRLAIFGVGCAATCRSFIDIYDINSNRREVEIDVSALVQVTGSDALCHLDWSPDGITISFMTSCDGTAPGIPRELYIVSTRSSTITAITDYTTRTTTVVQPMFNLFADYSPVWFDAQTLVAGAIFSTPEIQGAESIIYNTTTRTVTRISTAMMDDVVVNPVTDEMAYRLITITAPSIQPDTAVINIATFDGITLKTIYAGSAGCDLSWSPDGAVLAYTDTGSPFTDCIHYAPLSVNFVDRTGAELGRHLIVATEASPYTAIISLGWLAIA